MEARKAVASDFLRFGTFEIDFRSGELRKNGLRLKLEPKPFEALELLITRPGELIERERFYRNLWPETHVRYDRSLNTIINRLREVLGDSAANPRFVETLSRRGYRFIAPVRRAEAAAGSAVDSIAVLPFLLDSGAADAGEIDYLAGALAESLIHSLSHASGLRVLAASTVARCKNLPGDPCAAARELRVAAVLTGGLSRRGSEIGVTVELVDAADGARLWGQPYRGRLRDFAALQGNIAKDVTEKLRLRLAPEPAPCLSRHTTAIPEAYQEYLHGRFFLNKMTRDGLERAIASFERAIALDPQFASAWSAQADCCILLAFFGLGVPRQCLPRAKQAALRAIELDEGLAEAHASLAAVLKAYDWDWPAAEREYRRALDLNSNGSAAHRGYASLLAALGRTDEAMQEIERALALDPLSLVLANESAWNLYMGGQYGRAEQHSLRILELDPAFAPALYTAGLAREQMGNFRGAIDAFRQAQRLSQENPATIAALAHALALTGARAEAEQALSRLRQAAASSYLPACWMAIVHIGLGDTAAALQELDRACLERDVWLVWMKVDPRFHCLQPNPRFRSLLARTRLAA